LHEALRFCPILEEPPLSARTQFRAGYAIITLPVDLRFCERQPCLAHGDARLRKCRYLSSIRQQHK